MLTVKEVTLFYDTLLANKWVEQLVKMDLRLSRRNILALSRLIEIGLREENRAADSLLQAAIREVDALATVPAEMRKMADLTEMYEKMKELTTK
jgi:hypothetical protein